MRLTVALLFGILAGVLLSSPTLAAESPIPTTCQPLYNGGSFCKNSDVLTINKTVLKPGVSQSPGQSFADTEFVENIAATDMRYPANTPTVFRISLTNTSRGTLKNIVVKDVFPSRFLTFMSGTGSYDDSSRTFSTTITELKAKETKQITISVITARPDELPTDETALCTINLAMATVNNKTSQDTSQICVSRQESGSSSLSVPAKSLQNPTITKGGLPIVSPATSQTAKRTPDTGAEIVILMGLIPAAGLGFFLRRKTT